MFVIGDIMKKFSLLSDLKKQAYKDFANNKKSSNQSKLINQIIGINTVNKQWQDKALRSYELANRNIGFNRVTHLQESLVAIYACEYASRNSGVEDPNILKLKAKVENSYYNTCLEFIESCIHDEKKMSQYYNTLQEAVDLLEEYNSKLATQYKTILSRKKSLISSVQTIQETLEANVADINENQLEKIKTLIKHHEYDLKASPDLKEDILEDLRFKMDELLMYYQEKVEKEEKKQNPSLALIIKAYDEFSKAFLPLSDILEQRRYRTFIDKKEDYLQYQDFYYNQYPELVKTYQYYSLPRRNVDKMKLINAKRDAEKYNRLTNTTFAEFQEMSPTLPEIAKLFDNVLGEEFKDDLVNYYKIHNELINASDQDEIIPELIRFIKHLNNKIGEEKDHFLIDKLITMQEDNFESLDQSIQAYLQKNISSSKKTEHLKTHFDYILNHLFELGDIKRIEAMQTQKKTLIKAFDQLETWIVELKKDYELYQNLPESNLKYSLKDTLSEKIKKISDTLQLVNQYDMNDVGEISQLIYKIESKISNHDQKAQDQYPKLIILDQYTMKNFVVFCKESIAIGRDDDNDIVIPSDWVSNNHCLIAFKNGVLIDNNSTNGTFVDSTDKNITEAGFGSFKYFNIAGAFEFELIQFSASSKQGISYLMRLNRVTDLEVFKDNKTRELIQSLFNTEFIFLHQGDGMCLNKISGQISNCEQKEDSELIIEAVNNNFVLSDKSQSLRQKRISEITSAQIERYKFVLN